MHCYIIQYDIKWENPGSNLPGISRLLEQTSPTENALIVLPEMFATGFSMNTSLIAQPMDGEIIYWMKSEAIKYKSLIAGSVAIKEGNNVYNRFVFAFPDGKLEYYDKKHLFRMGEENDFYSSGKKRIIINYQGFRILPLVCYDLRFPVWSRNQNDYDLIVYAANWPASRAHAWDTLLMSRAIENQSFVIGANRCGNGDGIGYKGASQLIDFKGNIIKKAGEGPSIIYAQLDFESLQSFKNSFPVWKDADPFRLVE